MPSTLRDWLRNVPISDPLQRRQAGLFQIILLILIGSSLIGLPLGIMTRSSASVSFLGEAAYILLGICDITAFILLRRGRFTASVILVATSIMVVLGFVLIGTGLNSSGVLLAFTVPIVLAGLLLGRRALMLFTGTSVALVILILTLRDAKIKKHPKENELRVSRKGAKARRSLRLCAFA